LLIGIDFLFQGIWWMVLGAFIRRPSTRAHTGSSAPMAPSP
jgi:hypothetical protein